MKPQIFFQTRPFVDPWFTARDYFFGINGKAQCTEKAISVASTSKHPDAIWFCNVVAIGCDYHYFYKRYQADTTDIRALYFSSMLIIPFWGEHMRICAAANYFPARIACHTIDVEQAIAFGDPNGIYVAAVRMYDEYAMYLAAQCGSIDAIESCYNGWMYANDPFRYVMVLKYHEASTHGTILGGGVSLGNIDYTIRKFLVDRDERYGPAVYWIGKCVTKDNIRLIGRRSLEAALDHYQVCNGTARLAVDLWTMIARRLRVVKDVRRIISEMIWWHRYEYATLLD